MKKRCSEEQIIGFREEAEVSMPVKELSRKHGFLIERYLARIMPSQQARGRIRRVA